MQWERFAAPRTFLLAGLTLGASLLAGCDATSAEDARVQIQLTDAPTDYFASADVWISHVYLQCASAEEEGEHVFAVAGDDAAASRADRHGDDEDDDRGKHKGRCPRVDLLNDSTNAFHVDLLDLHDGLVSNLTVPADLAPGRYDDLFVVVDSALVTLKEPFHFVDGSPTARLRIAGNGKKAIRVELAEPLDVAAGQTTIVLVDFNLEDSFLIQGNAHEPAQIKSVLFIPRLLEKHRSHRG